MEISFIIIELLVTVFIFLLAGIEEKFASNKWRLVYATPFFILIIMTIVSGFSIYYTGLYIAALVCMVSLFAGKKNVKRTLAGAGIICVAISFAFVLVIPERRKHAYLDDFEKAFTIMQEHYVLDREKGIDFSALYKKYHPLFQEVDKTQDHVENYKLWQRYTGEFYDGHVGYQMKREDLFLDALMKSYGNDYGLSLIRLSSGEYAAVNVEGYENSYNVTNDEKDDMGIYRIKNEFLSETADCDRLTLKNAGIKNGTIITKWNGKPIDEYFGELSYYFEQYPVRENEEFYQPVYVAGIGMGMNYGETCVPADEDNNASPSAEITFINDDGIEETVTALSLCAYFPRMYDTINRLDAGTNISNLEWQEIDEETVMMRISEMAYDQETYNGADYTEMTDELRKQVLDYKSKGIKNIVIDLRSNGGGSPYFVEGVACLFAPEGEHSVYYSAVINEDTASFERDEDGMYKKGHLFTYQGENLWADGKIILLVNNHCVSAGDDMTYVMGDFPNVKVMGTTRSNSSCQTVKVVELSSSSISFSAVPNLLPSGEVAIDTYTDHVGRTPFDEKIPMTTELISGIFDKGDDYILQYVVDSFTDYEKGDNT